MLTKLVLGVAIVGLLPATAFAGLGPRTGAEYRYEVRAMGAKVGEATLSISKFKKVGKRVLREVTLEGKTSGMGATIYSSNTTSRSWVDGAWLPVMADWDAVTPKGKRELKATYWTRGRKGGGGARGIYKRAGEKDYRTNFRLKLRPTDLVSFFAMIPNANLKPGQKLRMPLYDGWRVYDLRAKVGKPVQIHVPYTGKVKALPVKVVAKQGKITREVVYWLDAKTHEPLKLSFSFGMIGRSTRS